jgi:hypothetical protein
VNGAITAGVRELHELPAQLGLIIGERWQCETEQCDERP